jgi:tetratricopeptide (TPR) repeat protein
MANDMDGTENLARQALKNAQADSDRGLIEYALELLNYLWLTSEENQKGIEFFSEFLERHSDDATAFHCRGIHLWYSGHPEEAIADYNRSLELKPDNAFVLVGRGQILVELDRGQDAIRDLEKVLQLANTFPNARNKYWAPTQAYTRNGLGAASAAIGDFARAFDEFALSVDLQPNNAWVYFNRAQAHDKRNDYLKAVADYTKSLVSEEPKLPAYKRNLAESRVKELGALGFEGAT